MKKDLLLIGRIMNKKIVAKKGVTLMELLVVLALLSIVSLSLFTVFRTATESYSKGDARTQAYQNARAALEQMSREIQGALMDSAETNITFQAFDETLHSGWKTDSSEDELFFVAPVNNSGHMDLCEIGYWLRGTDSCLMRHFQVASKTDNPPLDFDFSTGSSDQFGFNINDLQFAYWYRNGGYWTNEWSVIGEIPEAVKISIDATDEKKSETNTFSTIVYLPNAK